MGYNELDRTGARHPTREVKRVTLEDGLHASLILENGRICKLVSPSGEVAVLQWEVDQASPRPPAASSSQIDPPRVSPRGGPAASPEGFDAARNFWASKSTAGSKHQASGAKDRRGRRGSSEQSVSSARAPAHTSESSEANTEASGPAQGRCIAAAVPEDTAEGLPTQTQHTGVAGVEGLDISAAASETDAPEAHKDLGNAHTEDSIRQEGALQQPPAMKDEKAVNFWPDVDHTSGVDGEVEQGADERSSPVANSLPVEAEAPAEQQGQAQKDEHAKADASSEQQTEAEMAGAEHAEQTIPQASQHNLKEEQIVSELPEEASQHSLAGEHVHAEPEEAELTRELVTEEPEEASQRGSEEDDRLEELMGAVPTINLRELRTQVASLPEILSRAERTAELCARGSAPGLPGLQGPSPHKLADGSIHSWVAQSRATAIMMQREEHMPSNHHGFRTAATQPKQQHDVAERDMARHEEPGSRAEGSAAGSPGSSQPDARRRLTAKRSLAEVRAAIGIVPSAEATITGEAPQPAKEEEATPHKDISEAEADAEPQALIQTAASMGTSVWGRLFLNRRVRPDSAGSRASAAMSAAPSPAKMHQLSMTERLFGSQRKPKGITLAEWPEKPCAEAMAAAQPSTEPAVEELAAAKAMEEPTASAATSALTQQTEARQSTRKLRRLPSKATATRTGMAGRWRMEESEEALAGAQQVEDLLDLPLLQRLAQQRAQEIRILETDDTLEFIQIIPLNGRAKIVRRTVFPKSGKMVESARADSREGKLRSQLNISPEGHCHMRSLQGEPYAAVFHRRIKMSSGGHRLKIEQKFQLLAPGVMPIKYHSIWHRIEDSDADDMAALCFRKEPLLEM